MTWPSREPESRRGAEVAAGPAELAVHRLVTVFWWLARRASSCPPASVFQILHTQRQCSPKKILSSMKSFADFLLGQAGFKFAWKLSAIPNAGPLKEQLILDHRRVCPGLQTRQGHVTWAGMHLISVPPAVASSDPPGSQAVASTGAPCSIVMTHCR